MEGTLLMPMAGLGSRFNNTEYKLPKPLIEVDQEAMSVKAYKDIPAAKNNIAVLRKDLIGIEDLKTTLEKEFTNLNIIELDQLTNGQAITCYQALKEVEDLSGPLTISACDNGVIFNNDELKSLLSDEDVDIIVWAAKGYPGASRNPDMYGWLHADENNKILGVSVKKPLSNPDEDFVIIGTFTYKNANMFNSSVESLIKRGGAINSEFYIDSSIEDSINQGLVCKIFEVEKYICWGTPNDLRTYEYWESCFSKWPSHPYRG
jgi:dTDP-glucose pyrophosphorylase